MGIIRCEKLILPVLLLFKWPAFLEFTKPKTGYDTIQDIVAYCLQRNIAVLLLLSLNWQKMRQLLLIIWQALFFVCII